MVAFAPTEDQQMIVETIGRFAREKVRGLAHDADEERAYPRALIEEAWSLGLVAAWVPEDHGGIGEPHTAINAALFAEELAYGDLALALYVTTPALFGVPLLRFGSAAQRERWLPVLAQDAFPALTAALTESAWDFDPMALATTAHRDGDDYILSGAKVRVPLAGDAQALLVYARDESAGGTTQAFIVARETPGLSVGPREALMGLRALPTYELTLDNCRVPASARLGEERGIDITQLLNLARVTGGALAVGVARAALEHALTYAKERQAFGKHIAQFQSIAFMLAEMRIEVDAARLMVWEAAWTQDAGRATDEATRTSVLGARYADETAMMVADRAVQIYGGHGYIREHPVELLLRNARGFATLTGMTLL